MQCRLVMELISTFKYLKANSNIEEKTIKCVNSKSKSEALSKGKSLLWCKVKKKKKHFKNTSRYVFLIFENLKMMSGPLLKN